MKVQYPELNEHSEYHATLISLVPEEKFGELLAGQIDSFPSFVETIPDDQTNVIHKPYGWTVHQVIEHIVDAERVFGYRALRFATGDQTPLPGWDENTYSATEYGRNVSLSGLAQEFAGLRIANLALLNRLEPTRLENVGTADNKIFSVRSIAYLMVGHAIHHIEILKKRLA